MVDSPKKKTFMETIGTLAVKLETLRTSVDTQFAEVNRRFEQIDKRFDAVDEQVAEQRGYVEFPYERLEKSLGTRLDRIERKLDQFIDLNSQSRKDEHG
jgi:tetrahydromethanopterin S-methyltransferase subunit G